MELICTQKEMRAIAANYVKPFSYVVEIGCGKGNFAEELINRGILHYLGLDINKESVQEAIKNVPKANFIVRDAFDIIYVLNDADVIVALEVFEHIENDFELIEKIPSGKRVIFSVPNSPYRKEHKRWFELSGWKKRYKHLFDFEMIFTIQHPKKKDKRAFLFITTKK